MARIVLDLGAKEMPGVELYLAATAFPGEHWPTDSGAWRERTAIGETHKAARYLALFRLLRTWKPHVVHSHQEAYAPVVARCAGVPVRVETIHAGPFWEKLGHPLVRQLRKAAVTRHVAVSEGLRADLVARGLLLPAQVTAIPNGVDVGELRQRPIVDDAPVIGTVARFDADKGLESLTRAFAVLRREYPGARLVLVGDGPYRPVLEALIRELGLGGAVSLPGYVPDPRAHLRELDLFVLPSLHEGFGLALAEAMAEGVPVVASDLPGPASLCRHEREGLLVRPGDAAAIAVACRRLLADAPLRERMRRAAYDRVASEFSVERMLQAHLDLYRSLLGGQPAPRTEGTVAAR